MKTQYIQMDDMFFNYKPDVILKTDGVTSCIAFVVIGQFWRHDELIPFSGLYHWSGMKPNVINDQDAVLSVLDNFFIQMRSRLYTDPGSKILINRLAFVGGERCQKDAKGNLILSGTEKEVEALISLVKNYNYRSHKVEVKDIEHLHYQTSNNESLAIEVHMNHWDWERQCAYESDEDMEECSNEENSRKFANNM